MSEDPFSWTFRALSSLHTNRPQLFTEGAGHGKLRGIQFYKAAPFIAALAEGARLFKSKHGQFPSLSNPQTFNEKIFFLKYFANFPVPSLGDKLAAREYARARLGAEFMPHLVWVGRDLDSFDPSNVPAGRYWLKANHGSGFGRAFNLPEDLPKRRDELRGASGHWLATNYGTSTGEWWYGNFEKLIFIERQISTHDGSDPPDYKFYCFNGRAELIHTDTDRFSGHKRNFYDRSWRELPVAFTYPRDKILPAPKQLDRMLSIAEQLSADLVFARVDLYVSEFNSIKFGEITLCPENACGIFDPLNFDLEMGALLDVKAVWQASF